MKSLTPLIFFVTVWAFVLPLGVFAQDEDVDVKKEAKTEVPPKGNVKILSDRAKRELAEHCVVEENKDDARCK